MTTRRLQSLIGACGLIGALALAGGCYDTYGGGYGYDSYSSGPDVYVVNPPPRPAPIREVYVQSPGPGYVWIEGSHDWNGRRWDWHPGRWERPGRPDAVWVRGDFDHDNRGYKWKKGHWR